MKIYNKTITYSICIILYSFAIYFIINIANLINNPYWSLTFIISIAGVVGIFAYDIINYINNFVIYMRSLINEDEEILNKDNDIIKNKRKLVTVRTIDELLPIEGADLIELAKIDGWQLVVKKGEFNVGDKCLYFEIDSMLPLNNPLFEFLRPRGVKILDGIEYHKLKTIRMRGEISQGLALPLNEELKSYEDNTDVYIDYSGTFGVIKYEPSIDSEKGSFGYLKRNGNFPTHLISKTDEERIQNLFNTYKFNDTFSKYIWKVSEKLDGTSFTCLYNENSEFITCSRNFIVGDKFETWDDFKTENGNKYTNIARKYKLNEVLASEYFKKDFAIQGEIIGPGIQGNKYKLNEDKLYAFNIQQINYKKTKLFEFYSIPESIQTVPDLTNEFKDILYKFDNNTIELKELLLSAEGKSKLNAQTEREGVVFVGMNKENSNDIISFKVISNKFLLKNNEE